jgi:hypothetical protein
MSTFTHTRVFGGRLDTKTLFGFAIATALGVLLAAYPLASLGAVAVCLTLYGIFRWSRGRLEFWQALVLLALTPYIILNYGFDNFAIGAGGYHFPVGDLLMFLALALVIWRTQRSVMKSTLLDPPVACLVVLLLLTSCHLLIDVPRYGFYAVRDSSMFFEAVFLILGVMWSQNPRSTELLKRWLFYVFLINLFYSYTFSWGEKIQAMSPSFGVFHPVPLFGYYQGSAVLLLLGAMYFVWIAPSIVRWPRWILMLLAAAQLGGLAIHQVRSMYVGIAVILVVLLLLRENKKLVGFASTIGLGFGVLLALLLAVSALGIKLEGRMGPVDLSFVEEQAKTVLAVGDANARMSHDVDRANWYGQVWDRICSSPTNIMVGEGFGQALINFVNEEGIPVRQPHNSSLTVLARLGFLGLSIWLLFIVLVLVRYVRILRIRSVPEGASATILWLFLCFLLVLIHASVQPSLELSHGSIPFYFLLGLGIGIMEQMKDGFDPQSFGVSARRTAGS